MAKRGRPRKNGVKQGWVLARALLALQGYGTPERLARSIPEALKGGVAAFVKYSRTCPFL